MPSLLRAVNQSDHNLNDLFRQFRFLFRRALTNDSEAMNRLPFYFVVGADRRGLSYIGMTIIFRCGVPRR